MCVRCVVQTKEDGDEESFERKETKRTQPDDRKYLRQDSNRRRIERKKKRTILNKILKKKIYM